MCLAFRLRRLGRFFDSINYLRQVKIAFILENVGGANAHRDTYNKHINEILVFNYAIGGIYEKIILV